LTAPLSVWAVSDGRAGIENQVLGLAEAVARLMPAEITVKRVAYRGGLGRWPQVFNLAPRSALAQPLDPPWPDVWIAAGRATLPLSVRVRRWSGGRTLVVQVQAPRWPARLFDLVIAPEHDRIAGPNVVTLLGAPHRVTAERLDEAAAMFADRLDPLPRPRVAVLVGGKSKAFDLSPERVSWMADEVASAVVAAGGSILATVSRRTPEAARTVLERRWANLPGWIWNGAAPNPYFGFLAAADAVLVTQDSANMAVEAGSTGKPVHVLPMDGGSAKFARFHAALRDRGIARPFTGDLTPWTYEPLRVTERAARAVIDSLERRGQL
jgi:mitochondrial fission protein ELM1